MVERKQEVTQKGNKPQRLCLRKRVFSETNDRRIEDLKKDYDANRLELQPDFQRLYVWNDSLASFLVESILLNMPIETIYTAINPETFKEEVADGQQRLTSVFRFMRDEFALRGLTVLEHLNGKKFSELNREEICSFLRYTFSVTQIKANSDPRIKYEIFIRLNS